MGNSSEMVIDTFLLGFFLVFPIKKSDISVKYKR